MCDRFAQQYSVDTYLHELNPAVAPPGPIGGTPALIDALPAMLPTGAAPIAPNSRVMVFLNGPEGIETRYVRWGWTPVWAMGTRPPLTHLPLRTASSSKAFQRVWREGRVLVAADGWFEVAHDPVASGSSRAVYFSHASGRPVFLAGLAQISEPASGCDGLVLVSLDDAAQAGHQRLLALQGADALNWLDPGLEAAQALERLSGCLLGDPAFHCAPARQRAARKRH